MDLHTKTTLASSNSEIDTNAEYISTQGINSQPPIITSVFRSIFVETPKDFFNGIKNFFKRYITLFGEGYKYLKYPSLKLDPFATKDYKESCQQTFEMVLIVTALIIFLVKMDVIPVETKLSAAYGNDISQMLMEFFVFVIFAVVYFLMVVCAVLAGRLFRMIFKIPITRHECDILFTYLNNTLFIITLVISFFARCFVKAETVKDNNTFFLALVIFYMVTMGMLTYRWSLRFTLLNQVPAGRQQSFQISVTLITAFFVGFSGAMITSFMTGL